MRFEEKQRLNLWWLYILLGIETIIVGSIVLFDENGLSLQQLKDTYFAPVLAILIPYPIVFMVNRTALSVKIDGHGIEYRMIPFFRKKTLGWNQLEKAYLRKYDALGEYGGWGAKHRLWFKLKDKAYIFNDSAIGLQLILKNGRKILLSTSKPDELNLFLINLKQKFHIGAVETDVRER